MRIGIICHSKTGHTQSVCEALKHKLAGAGHQVRIEPVVVKDGDDPMKKGFSLKALPDVSDCDAVVFGAPVWGFSVSPVMRAFLERTPPLAGKRAACLVTMSFPMPWLGGNRAIRQMQSLCRAKGAADAGFGIVSWSDKRREQDIAAAVERIAASL